VQEPKVDFRDGKLISLSERRPLVIEAIVALVRIAESYSHAADLFQQHAGANVREYVFRREWDALPKDGLARHLLIGLSEIGRPASFKDLEAVQHVDPGQIIDAIGAAREMFLQIEGAGDGAKYSLAVLTKQFVIGKRTSVSRYDVLKARVKSFNRYVHVATPRIARMTLDVERLLPPRAREHPGEHAQSAWMIVSDRTLPAQVTEEPTFRSLRGYVACCLASPRITDAREDFSYALRMSYEPEYNYLKKWFYVERGAGQFEGGLALAADTVIKGNRYTLFEKTFMASGKAFALYLRARDRVYTDTVDAKRDFLEALKLNLFVYKAYIDEGYHWASDAFEPRKEHGVQSIQCPIADCFALGCHRRGHNMYGAGRHL
jgi:hypothetical protein